MRTPGLTSVGPEVRSLASCRQSDSRSPRRTPRRLPRADRKRRLPSPASRLLAGGSLGGLARPRQRRGGAATWGEVPHLTGARCDEGLLRIRIDWRELGGFTELLRLFGSYHVFDYDLSYLNIRRNAAERVAAYRTSAPRGRWSYRVGGMVYI